MIDEKKEKPSDFDFDTWSAMAQQNPEKFEAMRQQLIDDLIAKTPAHLRQRMIGLQWQIDQMRRQAANPLAACIQISNLMWDSVLGEKGLLNALREPRSILKALKSKPPGKVLSLEHYKSTK